MYEKLLKEICYWIKAKVSETGTNGAVFGLSGGIDSAVVAGICKLALGDNAIGIVMPCHSCEEDMQHAYLVAKAVDLKTEKIDLTGTYDNLISALPKGRELAYSNIKPRLRMTTLYYFANLHNYLVVGTGNRSEVSVGYFTKYGDGGVDIMPIADLLKKEVVAMAKELGIPEEIINKPPSAGLWDGQTDEKEMGITYRQLDSFLEGSVDNGTDSDDPMAAKIKDMIGRAEHKRRLPGVFRRK